MGRIKHLVLLTVVLFVALLLTLLVVVDEETISSVTVVQSFRKKVLFTKQTRTNAPSQKTIKTTYSLLPYNTSIDYASEYKCRTGPQWFDQTVIRQPLSPHLARYMTSFSTELETNANLLVLGDSVGMQFYGMLKKDQEREIFVDSYKSFTGTVRVNLAVSFNTNRAVAGWRITDFLTLEKENTQLPGELRRPPEQEGGWTRERVELLRNQTSRISFDTLLFRIPIGWQPLERVTVERLDESLRIAHEVAGVTTAILLTLPYISHIRDPALAPLLREKK